MAENETEAGRREEFYFLEEWEAFQRKNPTGWKYYSVIKDGHICEPIVVSGVECFPLYSDAPLAKTLIEEHRYALLPFELDGKRGYVNIYTGKIEIPPEWDWAMDFIRGYALVRTDCSGKSGALKPQPPGHYSSTDFGDDGQTNDANWGWELTENARCGLINREGKTVVPMKYVDGYPGFTSPYFIPRLPDFGFGMIDVDENIMIDFSWSGIGRLRNMAWKGLIAYKSNSHWYDHTGVWKGVWSTLGARGHLKREPYEQSEDQAVAYYHELDIDCPDCIYAVFNESGELIIGDLDQSPLRRYGANDDENGKHYLVVSRNDKYGLIKDGNLLLEPELTLEEIETFIRKDW